MKRYLPLAVLLLTLACACVKRPTLEPIEPVPEPVWNSIPMMPSQLVSEFRTSPEAGAEKYRRVQVRVFGHISDLGAHDASARYLVRMGDTPETPAGESVRCLVSPGVASRLAVGLPVTVRGHPAQGKGPGLELQRCVLESIAER